MIESPYLQSIVEEVVAERMAKEVAKAEEAAAERVAKEVAKVKEAAAERVAKEVAREHQKNILQILTKRFGLVPVEIRPLLEAVSEESRLDELLDWAVTCPDLEAFRARLSA